MGCKASHQYDQNCVRCLVQVCFQVVPGQRVWASLYHRLEQQLRVELLKKHHTHSLFLSLYVKAKLTLSLTDTMNLGTQLSLRL